MAIEFNTIQKEGLSVQIANAIRRDVSLTSSPEDPANRRRYLRNISELLEDVEPVTINFGSLMRERTTAKRLMMQVKAKKA